MNTRQRLQIRLTCQAQAADSGIILPAGAIGQVLDYERGEVDKDDILLVDFGLRAVIRLPINSPLAEIVTGPK